MNGNETIAAVSTAPGEGGIGIVRVSGSRAAEIAGKIFVPCPGDFLDRVMYYGHIIDPSSGEKVDEVFCVYMRGPRSYTGEDVCEIQCHGGSVPLRRILGLVCRFGAVPAQPGEFTKRAFLNGRLDLAQAGAVIDLIRSKTERGYTAARDQAEGRLSEQVSAAREILLEVLAEIAVRIDYPEEFEGDRQDQGQKGGFLSDLHFGFDKAEGIIAELLEGYEAGRIIRDGLRVVIIGKPNAGKSSLFNALAREDTAIVTSVPGTTRDALEVWLDVRGVPVLLVDTAGLRDSVDEVERLGARRALMQYERADLCIILLDGSEPFSEEDLQVASCLDPAKKHIVAINKTDLPQALERSDAAGLFGGLIYAEEILELSLIDDKAGNYKAMTATIEDRIEEIVVNKSLSGSSLLVTKEQHKGLLEAAAAEIREARAAVFSGASAEFFEVNIRGAYAALGEIIGEEASDDVIEKVFEEFCVGK